MQQSVFGNLTLKRLSNPIDDLYNKYQNELDYIFQNTDKKLQDLTVIEAERKIALEHLRALTKRMQSNRLKQNAKVFCKYFTD